MKRIVYLVMVIGVLLGCGERREYREMLSRAEEMMNSHPDSALMILDSLGQHEKEFGRHFRMQYLLHRTNAASKTSERFTSDSLVKDLADHFDSRGTTNERVLAHYLLGLAYSDMGEAPKAVNSFQDAIEAADTTASDFNFATLSCAYSQMATIYHRQLLLTNDIEARKKASYYAFRANQLQWALYDKVMSAGAYILLNKKDSAEIILKSALEQYRKYGYRQRALRYSKTLMYLYTQDPQRLTEAKALMDQFEAESGLFDEHHELPPSHRQFYDYKGRYYEGIHQLDSAEYYYRKLYHPGMPFVVQDPMYRGLLSVFSKRHQADSIAKYAQLYGMANDSSIALKDRDQIAQMAALYNYSRSQKEAEQEREKTRDAFTLLGFIILVAFVIIIALSWLYQKKQKARKAKIAMLESSLTSARLQRSAVQEELRKLKEKDYEGIIAEKEEFEAELTDTIERLEAENEKYKLKDIAKETDHFEDFLDSKIAQLFVKKAAGRTEKPQVTEAEWIVLENQFSKDNPVTYKSFGKGRPLSQLEQRICILLVLDIPENAISIMAGTSTSTISNLKARANEKLFGRKEAQPLKNNLKHALQRSW